jgi:hypothetical protein
MKKLKVPNKAFKHWVIIAKTLRDDVQMHRLDSLIKAQKTFDAYLDCWLFEKPENEMMDITTQLESNWDKNALKEFYWDYSLEIQNMTDGERYLWLLKEMKSILLLTNDDLKSSYSRKFEESYIEWMKDSELFD